MCFDEEIGPEFDDDAIILRLCFHIIFSTRGQTPYLVDDQVREALYQQLYQIGLDIQCPCYLVSGSDDHVHLLIEQASDLSVQEVLDNFKLKSAESMRARGGIYSDFDWQESDVTFGVGHGCIEEVKEHLAKQMSFHRDVTYKDEIRSIFEELGETLTDEFWE